MPPSPAKLLCPSVWANPEMDWAAHLLMGLKDSVSAVVEPESMGFIVPHICHAVDIPMIKVHAASGYLFSSILAGAVNGTDLRELEVKLWNEDVALAGEKSDAAVLLYHQLVARMEAQGNRELAYDLVMSRAAHTEAIASYVTVVVEMLSGLHFSTASPWEAMRKVSRDEGAVILLKATSSGRYLDRFFDTEDKVTWKDPETERWNNDEDWQRLFEESQEWDATLVVVQRATIGHCVHPEPVYARYCQKGRNEYIWTNKPERVLSVKEISSRSATRTHFEKLQNPILPPCHRITAESEVGVMELKVSQARYYKEVWAAGIEEPRAACEFAVLVDGYIVGIAGLANASLGDEDSSLLLIYTVGARHETKDLTRLVTSLATTRLVLELVLKPWLVVGASKVITKRHSSLSALNGVMTLTNRESHAQLGFELTYAADIEDRTVEEVFQAWLKTRRPRSARSKARSRN